MKINFGTGIKWIKAEGKKYTVEEFIKRECGFRVKIGESKNSFELGWYKMRITLDKLHISIKFYDLPIKEQNKQISLIDNNDMEVNASELYGTMMLTDSVYENLDIGSFFLDDIGVLTFISSIRPYYA